jgi:hypothetical protein
VSARVTAHVRWWGRPTSFHVRAGTVVTSPLEVVLAVVFAVCVFGDFCNGRFVTLKRNAAWSKV